MARKLILFIASSLDGFIARKNGDVDWLFTDQDYGYRKFFASVDTVLMGRKTYEKALIFEKQPFKGKKCYVFTKNKSKNHDGNVKYITKDIIKFVKGIKTKNGKDIWLVGGSQIINEICSLIDEFKIFIHPILLGKGISLFKSQKEIGLVFKNARSFNSGLVELNYTRK